MGCQNQQPWQEEDEYLQATASSDGVWEAPGARGQIQFNQGEYREAIRSFEQALALSPVHRRPYYLEWIAACHLVLRDYEKAQAACDAIRAIDPGDLVALATRLKVCEALGDAAEGRRLCETALARRSIGLIDEAELLRFHARFLAGTGSVEAAIQVYEDLLRRGSAAFDFVDHLRLLYVRAGRYADAFAAWRRKWGADLAFDEGNWLASRYRNAERLGGLAEARGASDPQLLFHLASAYASIGWTDEARAVLEKVARVPAAVRLADTLERTGRLVERIQERVYGGYRTYLEEGEAPGIDETVEALAADGRDLGIDLGSEPVQDLSLLHHFVNPHVGSGSPLPVLFRRQGQLFVLFDYFGPIECNLKSILFLDARRTREVWGRPVEYEMAICESSRIYHYREFLGGSSYGGLAISPRGFWLDLDTYRRIARHVAGYYLRHRASYEALFPAGDGAAAIDRPIDAVYYSSRLKERLAYLVGLQFADASDGRTDRLEEDITRALVESAEYHELGHLVVQRGYLPISAHLVKGLGLLLREGFSSEEIGAWSEEQAQLTSLAHSRHPHLSLYRTVSSLSKNAESSRHSRGYRRILEGFVREILAAPERYPNLRTDRPILEQIYLLTGDQIRELATRLYRG